MKIVFVRSKKVLRCVWSDNPSKELALLCLWRLYPKKRPPLQFHCLLYRSWQPQVRPYNPVFHTVVVSWTTETFTLLYLMRVLWDFRYFMMFLLHLSVATIYASYFNVIFLWKNTFFTLAGFLKLMFPLAIFMFGGDMSMTQLYRYVLQEVWLWCLVLM